MDIISPDKKRIYTVVPVDSKGRVAPIDGVPVWTVNPTGGVALFPAADGMTCEVAWVAPVVLQVLTVEADADLGAGVILISATADIQTTDLTATTLQLTAGPEIDL